MSKAAIASMIKLVPFMTRSEVYDLREAIKKHHGSGDESRWTKRPYYWIRAVKMIDESKSAGNCIVDGPFTNIRDIEKLKSFDIFVFVDRGAGLTINILQRSAGSKVSIKTRDGREYMIDGMEIVDSVDTWADAKSVLISKGVPTK